MKKVGKYTIQTNEFLGKGQFGQVVKGFLTDNPSEQYAVKMIRLATLTKAMEVYLEGEIASLKAINSPSVVRLFDQLKTANFYYLFMELCPGGNLKQFLEKNDAPGEELARRWLWNIANALHDIRGCNITHRDLKLANVVLTHSDPEQATAKLSDFGFARYASATSLMQSWVGSPLSAAPELLLGIEYNYKVDTWSFGVLAYTLLVGEDLYSGIVSIPDLVQAQRREIQFPIQCQLSPQSKDFIKRLLIYDSNSRPSFEELKRHPFFSTHRGQIDAVLQQPSPIGSLRDARQREIEQFDQEILKTSSYCSLVLPSLQALALKYIQLRKNLVALAIAQNYKRTLEEFKTTFDTGRDSVRLRPTGEQMYQEIVNQITNANTFIQTQVNLSSEDLTRSVMLFGTEGIWVDGRLLVEEALRLETESAETDLKTQLVTLKEIDLMLTLAGNQVLETADGPSLLKRIEEKRKVIEGIVFAPN